MERLAECGCGRLKVRVTGEPLDVMACHCDFCLKRTGSAYPVAAWFSKDQVLEVSGESTTYNGLEVDGVGPGGGDTIGISYHFCPTCGSTVYWTFDTLPDELTEMLADVFVVAVGNFADPDFPPPVQHHFPDLRPRWLTPHPDPV